MPARKKSAPKELTDSVPVTPEEAERILGKDWGEEWDTLPDAPPLVPAKPQFSDFNDINVPIAAVRMELSALQKDGSDYMPLSDFLLMIHRLVKADRVNK